MADNEPDDDLVDYDEDEVRLEKGSKHESLRARRLAVSLYARQSFQVFLIGSKPNHHWRSLTVHEQEVTAIAAEKPAAGDGKDVKK